MEERERRYQEERTQMQEQLKESMQMQKQMYQQQQQMMSMFMNQAVLTSPPGSHPTPPASVFNWVSG